MADILAHKKGTQESRIERCNALRTLANEIIEQEQCFKIKDLMIDGYDVMEILGVPEGKEVGLVLSEILKLVIDEELENDRTALIGYIKTRC